MKRLPPSPLGPADEPFVRPYVHEGQGFKAMHFSLGEVQSRMDLADPDALALEYTRRMAGFLLFKPDAQQVAMIGLGGGSLIKFCHRHLPSCRLCAVEINPHVLALRDAFRVPPDDGRLSVRLGDGADFVRDTRQRWDVLIVDGFDYDGQPAALCSQRFYDDCLAALEADGLLVANLGNGHPQHEVFVDRIRRSFDDRVLVVDAGEPGNSVVFASRSAAFQTRRPVPLQLLRTLPAAQARPLRASLALVAAAHARWRR